VQPEICIGAGNCVLATDGVFDQDEDGVVELLVEHPAEDQRPAVERAVDRCPAGAITLG